MTEGAGKEKCQKKDREEGAGKEKGVGVDPGDPNVGRDKKEGGAGRSESLSACLI